MRGQYLCAGQPSLVQLGKYSHPCNRHLLTVSLSHLCKPSSALQVVLDNH